MKKGRLIIISGPSAAVGKDTLIKLFLAKHPEWEMPPSVTTRQARPQEVDGQDMIFVSRAQFEQWQKQDKFLETDYHANNWYGTLREPVTQLINAGKNVLLRLDVNGMQKLRAVRPDVLTIFITAENMQAIERRLRERQSESEKQIQERLHIAKQELHFKDKYEHVIINRTGKLEQSLQELERIIGVLG